MNKEFQERLLVLTKIAPPRFRLFQDIEKAIYVITIRLIQYTATLSLSISTSIFCADAVLTNYI